MNINKNALIEYLAGFYGTMNYYQHFTKRVVYTDGVNYLAEKAECHWLIDEIAISILPKLLAKHPDVFYSIFLKVEDSKGEITVTDGNDHILLSKKIRYTDFPLDEINIFMGLSDKKYCLMLPREY